MRIFMFLIFITWLLSACTESTPQKQVKLTKKNIESTSVEEEFSVDQLRAIDDLMSSTPTDKINAVNAESTYKTYCGLCHGQKGEMSINGAKILMDTNTSLAERVAQIYYGKGTMTPFKGTLKDEQIIAVAQYIDELKK